MIYSHSENLVVGGVENIRLKLQFQGFFSIRLDFLEFFLE